MQLEREPNLKVETGQGSPVFYLTFNVTDPLLKDKRVRQAMACAIDRQAIVDAICGEGRRDWRIRCCRWGIGRRRAMRSWRSIRMMLRGRSGCWMRPGFLRARMACG